MRQWHHLFELLLLVTRQFANVVVPSLVSSAPLVLPVLLLINTFVNVTVPLFVVAAGPPVFPVIDPPVIFKVPVLL